MGRHRDEKTPTLAGVGVFEQVPGSSEGRLLLWSHQSITSGTLRSSPRRSSRSRRIHSKHCQW